LDWLRWVDSRDGMLIDDLGPSAPDKLDGEGVKRSDLALEPDPIRQKDGDLNSVVAKMFQEHLLKG
jgi:hypothetical protein